MRHNPAYCSALRDILRCLLCEGEKLFIRIALQFGGATFSFQGDFAMRLPDDKFVTATASFVDARGNAAAVDGIPVWGTDRPDLLSVTVDDAGVATIAAVGPLGSAQVTVDADADLGAGVVPLQLLATVEVISGQAVAGTIEFGEPQ